MGNFFGSLAGNCTMCSHKFGIKPGHKLWMETEGDAKDKLEFTCLLRLLHYWAINVQFTNFADVLQLILLFSDIFPFSPAFRGIFGYFCDIFSLNIRETISIPYNLDWICINFILVSFFCVFCRHRLQAETNQFRWCAH